MGLQYKLKLRGENFFNKGDVPEIDSLIDVDDKFVLNCAELIEQVSKEMRDIYPDYCL